MEPIGRLRHTEPPALCSALLFHHGLLGIGPRGVVLLRELHGHPLCPVAIVAGAVALAEEAAVAPVAGHDESDVRIGCYFEEWSVPFCFSWSLSRKIVKTNEDHFTHYIKCKSRQLL